MDNKYNNDVSALELNSDSSNSKENTKHCIQNEMKNNKLLLPDPNSQEKKDAEDIDYIFDHLVGSGKWNDFGQWGLFLAIIVVAYCGIFPIFMHIYAAFEPRHRCFIPNCDLSNTSSKIDVHWINFTSPAIHTKGEHTCQTEMLKVDEYFDPCQRYVASKTSPCKGSSFDEHRVQKCEKFVYDTLVVEESLTTKFNLVCDLEYQQMILGTIVMVGLMIGSVLGGRLSDKFGRKKAMILCVIIIVPTVMFAGYSVNFWMYATLKLINTIALPCIWFASHTLITEIFGKDNRQNAIVIKELMWPIGMLMIIGVFYFTRHWIYFHLWLGGLCLLSVPAFIIVPESPRWLSVNGKWESAELVFFRLAQWNRKKLTANDKEKVSSILRNLNNNLDVEKEQSLGVLHMINRENRTKTIIMTLHWIIVCVTTFTQAFNVTKLSGSVFVNSTLLTVFGDIPGKFFVWLSLKYCSRRFSLFIFQFVGGMFCIIIGFMPKEYELTVTSFYMVAMCSSNAAFALVYLITGELYPTNLRTRAIGACSFVSRIFGVSAAFMSKLSCIWKPLPMLVLGVPAMIIGCSVYFLPETKQKNLPLATKDA